MAGVFVLFSITSCWAQENPQTGLTPPAAPPLATPATPAETLATPSPAVITLTDGIRTITRTSKELGLAPSPNPTILKAALSRLAPYFAQDAINARPYIFNKTLYFSPGSYSRALNAPGTAENMLTLLRTRPDAHAFTVMLIKKPPVLTIERLRGVDGVLASVTTTAWVAAGRNKNIHLGVGRIDGTYLAPGEVFSLNRVVGPRTPQSGYKEAPIFMDAEKVPGIGGGISQVTGTVFNAAARAGMDILEAHLHSQPVSYLPLGQDATVAWGVKDMRFRNNTNAPVYIAMSFSRQKLTVTLFGKRTPGQIVLLKPVVQRLGRGQIDAQLYRTIKVNGQIVRKERLVTHQYRWTPE